MKESWETSDPFRLSREMRSRKRGSVDQRKGKGISR